MRSRSTFAVVSLLSLVACGPQEPDRPARPQAAPAPPEPQTVATFTGELDPAAGTLTLRFGRTRTTALTTIPESGGAGTPDTVALTQVDVPQSPQSCAAGVPGFEGLVLLRSFYAGAELRNVYAEITRMSAPGHEGCNSAAAVPGTSSAMGLFAYGTLAPAGSPGDAVAATWRFRNSDTTRFTFEGRIVADVFPTTCAADAVCPAGHYCAGGTCTAKLGPGQGCGRDAECVSGFCRASFDGRSRQCVAGATDCLGASGPVATGTVTCGTDVWRVCTDGVWGGDVPRPARSPCTYAAGITGSGFLGDATCDAAATPPWSQTCQSCAGYLASASGCRASCSGDQDCWSTHYCAAGACVAKKSTGYSCVADNECRYNRCATGFYGNKACVDDPYACLDLTTTVPSGSGKCDSSIFKRCAAGVWTAPVLKPARAACTVPAGEANSGYLSDAVCNPASDPPWSQTCVSCGGYLATGSGCPASCTGDAGCWSTHFCSAGQTCVADGATGAACTRDGACQGGNCSFDYAGASARCEPANTCWDGVTAVATGTVRCVNDSTSRVCSAGDWTSGGMPSRAACDAGSGANSGYLSAPACAAGTWSQSCQLCAGGHLASVAGCATSCQYTGCLASHFCEFSDAAYDCAPLTAFSWTSPIPTTVPQYATVTVASTCASLGAYGASHAMTFTWRFAIPYWTSGPLMVDVRTRDGATVLAGTSRTFTSGGSNTFTYSASAVVPGHTAELCLGVQEIGSGVTIENDGYTVTVAP